MSQNSENPGRKRISVVTAVLNGEKYIRETINSVLQQEGDFEIEYIIRDGASTDKTLEIIREFGDRIIVVSEKDASPQEAINKGLDMATGDILCWLNADDRFEENALSVVLDEFNKHPEKQWLYGRCRIIDQDGAVIRKFVTLYKNILGYFFNRNVLLCENFINQPSTFWTRQLWEQGQPLSSKYKAAWDYHLWLKMSAISNPIVVRKYLANFRRHPGSISETQFVKQFKEELEIGKLYGSHWHNFIHNLNRRKTVWIYSLMNKTRAKN